MGDGRAWWKAHQNVRVLVTGATSLLARTTAEILLARGDDVVCLQRRRSTLAAEQVTADIRDATAVRRAMAGCDAIVHAAAPFGPFSTAMRAQADQIVVTSRFRFTRDDGLETTLSER